VVGVAHGRSRLGADVVAGLLLLAFGANPNARQQAGWTPLHAAAHRDQARLIRLLRNGGADALLCNDAGVDPASLAASEGRHAALAALQA